MILLDGRKLSKKILSGLKEDFSRLNKKLRLAVVVVGEDPAIRKFIAQKKKAAKNLGVDFKIYLFPENISTNELRQRLAYINHEPKNTGVIIQLPLSKHINTQYILNSITPEKDVDMLSSRAGGNFASGKSRTLPPVVGAISTLLEEYKIDLKNKNIVIVGAGGLVGKPTSIWLLHQKIGFQLVEANTPHPEEIIKKADILITGIGSPGYIKGDWVKDGVVVIDAGTSESENKLTGDVDFASVSSKASYITPVPGGVGPLTVAMLFKNLLILTNSK